MIHEWDNIGDFVISNDWVWTPPIKNRIIRITHLSLPIRNDYLKGVIAQAFRDSEGFSNIFSPQRLTPRNEREIFYLSEVFGMPTKLIFRRLDKTDNLIWKIKVESCKHMLINSSKQLTTNAQPLPEISVTNKKILIVPERADGNRRNYLIINLGNQTVYFKYVPLGSDPMLDTFVVSSSNYDFSLSSGQQWLDSTLTQNAVCGIASNAVSNTKIKATEYIYS